MVYFYDETAGNEQLKITNEQFSHLKARRLKAGERIDVRNLKDGFNYIYEIMEISRKEALCELIFKNSVIEKTPDFTVAWAVVENAVIEKTLPSLNEIGIGKVILVYSDFSQKNIKPDFVLVDAEKIKTEIPHLEVNHGDDLCYSIACASILAKVYRDSLCPKWDEEYPGYNFSKHKGYATTAHRAAIIELGASPIHRKSFLKNLDIWKQNSNIMGIVGEDLAVNFLIENGYEILNRNFRDYFGEIDIIAKKDDILSFVEVKERVSDAFGNAFEFVDKNKQEKIKKCAVSYVISKKIEDLQPRFDVVEVYPNEKKINFYEDAFQ